MRDMDRSLDWAGFSILSWRSVEPCQIVCSLYIKTSSVHIRSIDALIYQPISHIINAGLRKSSQVNRQVNLAKSRPVKTQRIVLLFVWIFPDCYMWEDCFKKLGYEVENWKASDGWYTWDNNKTFMYPNCQSISGVFSRFCETISVMEISATVLGPRLKP